MLILGFLLVFSIVVNCILVWYTRTMIRRYFWASEAASEIFVRLAAFSDHVKGVHELTTFYGDQTIKDLVKHADDLISFMSQFKDFFSFTQPELEDFINNINNGEKENKNEENSQTD